MPHTSIDRMLRSWNRQSIEHQEKEIVEIPVAHKDIHRLKALSEVYRLPLDQLVVDLLDNALDEVEARMPYVPGDRIIRVEEGEPVYEDVGLTPRYLAAKRRLEEEDAKSKRKAS